MKHNFLIHTPTTMKHNFLILSLIVVSLIVVVQLPQASASTPLIEKACANAVQKDLCIRSLTALPAEKTADIKAIVLSSINIANTQGSTTVTSLAEKLEDSEVTPDVEPALTDCSKMYKEAMMGLKNAVESINKAKAFDDQFFSDLSATLSGAMKSATICQDGLKKSSGSNTVIDNNNVFLQDCDIALAVTNFWSKNH